MMRKRLIVPQSDHLGHFRQKYILTPAEKAGEVQTTCAPNDASFLLEQLVVLNWEHGLFTTLFKNHPTKKTLQSQRRYSLYYIYF